MHKKTKWIIIALICSVLLAGLIHVNQLQGPYTDKRAAKILSNYERQLTAIAEYMVTESPQNRFHDTNSSYGDWYSEADYLPVDISKYMNIYFERISTHAMAEIRVIHTGESWGWYGLEAIDSPDAAIVSFFLSFGGIGNDDETGSEIQLHQYLFYAMNVEPSEIEHVFGVGPDMTELIGFKGLNFDSLVHLKGNWYFCSRIFW